MPINPLSETRKKNITFIISFSFVVSLLYFLGYSLQGPMNIFETAKNSLYSFVVSFIILCVMYFYSVSANSKKYACAQCTLKSFLIIFLTFVLVYSFAFLTYCPGTSYNDTTLILRNGMMMGNQYPVLFCFIMVLISKIGTFLGSVRITYELYCIVQMLLICAMSAWISLWIFSKPVPKLIKIFSYIYLLLNPIFSVYAVSVIKDTLFSISLVVFATIYYDIMVEDSFISHVKWHVMGLSVFFLYSYRNNGIYVLIPLLIIMFIKKKNYIRQAICLFAEILLLFIAVKILLWRFDIVPYFKESLAIPLQQISATVYYDGIISDEQLAFIDKMLPLEMIKSGYDPTYADPIKWNPYFNDTFVSQNKFGFFKVWFGMLVNNFKIYVEAYLRETLWFWLPSNRNDVLLVTWLGGVPQEWLDANGLVITPLLKGKALETMYRYFNFGKLIPCEGLCIWVMFGCAFLRSLTSKKHTLLAFSPFILLWLTLMISAPVFAGTRYVLPILYGIPVFFSFIFLNSEKHDLN